MVGSAGGPGSRSVGGVKDRARGRVNPIRDGGTGDPGRGSQTSVEGAQPTGIRSSNKSPCQWSVLSDAERKAEGVRSDAGGGGDWLMGVLQRCAPRCFMPILICELGWN